MKVLTATRDTQGWRDDDFCWTVEGELVLFAPIECGHGYVDDGCGCRRSMAGVVSHRATTTVKVVERNDLDPHTYCTFIADALASMGYVPENVREEPGVQEWLRDLGHELIFLASNVAPGAVLERRGEYLNVRLPTA